jgi:2-polyprenyl-3-methyl-5-hydroxy-6-metoxy-1,4-benzoquinol methylase
VKTDRLAHRFDQRASRYDNPWIVFVGERELRQIRRFVPIRSTVLDFGCGTGRTTLDHLRRGCSVTAYDISSGMLEIARTKALRQGFAAEFVTDGTALAGRTWPIVTCIGVLDYYADPEPLLRTLAGHMAPAGRLVVTCPNALSPLAWAYALGSQLTAPVHPCVASRVRRVARDAGLEVRSLVAAFPPLPVLGLTLVAEMVLAAH